MKLKLDENLGERGRRVVLAAGHEVCTVSVQKLEAASDPELLVRCREEERALVTLDLDFANPLVYPPPQHAGVAVLRLPRKPSRSDLDQALLTLAKALQDQPLKQKLWIVEIGRVRVYVPDRPC